MSEALFVAAFVTLGFVGLAGITTFFFRIWQLGWAVPTDWNRGWKVRLAIALEVAASVPVAFAWFETVRKIYRCLTEAICGPNRAAGWIALAMFGGVYLAFELVILALRRIRRA